MNDRGVMQEFSRRRTRQIIAAVPVIVAMLFMFRAEERGTISVLGLSETVVFSMLVVLLLGAGLFALYDWRCPACEKYLGKSINPRRCPKCGVYQCVHASPPPAPHCPPGRWVRKRGYGRSDVRHGSESFHGQW